MGRKALVVGINYYQNVQELNGCVNDAKTVAELLETHENGDKNFGVNKMLCSDDSSIFSKKDLKDAIEELFKYDNDIALFYFSGHGYVESSGGYLITPECEEGDDGLSLETILKYANSSKAKNKIIIIDACHSGYLGKVGNIEETTIHEGVTILTSCKENQYAIENNAAGLFTSLMIDALNGAASNLLGEITPGAVYAHIDKSLDEWAQRPVFKTNVDSFTVLRRVNPPIEKKDLRRITEFFPTADFIYPLDPSYEPERNGSEPKNLPKPVKEKNNIFAILQKYNRLNLLVPVDAPHMWHAAMQSKSCKLTTLGKFYHKLILGGLI